MVMKKFIQVTIILFLTFCFAYLGTKKYDNTKKNEKVVFHSSNDDTLVNSYNVFKNTNHSKVLALLNKGESMIFMCTNNSEWCSKYAEIVNQSAINNYVDLIYYYNIEEDRSCNNATYGKIIDKLSSYLYKDNMGKFQLNVPVLLFVKDGNIKFFDDETSIVRGNQNINDYWTEEKINEKLALFDIAMKEFLDE